MQQSKIWLSSPHMGGNELTYIQEAFDHNWIAPLGPNVTGFETDLKQFLQTEKEVGALSSGTAAIHLGLILLGVKAGDEVLCQSMTFSASANPIAYQGATPIFIDSEKDTWNMCPVFLEEAIKDRMALGNKPKAIILVHLYGMPAKVDEIVAISKKYEIPILEDAAEALGATYKGKNCGTFGDFGVLSFNGNKIITTSGGGALVCNTIEAKQKAIFLATQARDEAPHYQHSQIGYNYRMSNIVAGIGRGQMAVLPAHIALRRKMHQFYKDIFKNVQGIRVFEEPTNDYFSNHWLSCILFETETAPFTSEKLRIALLKDNIESRPLWKPMHLQPIFSECAFYGTDISENLFQNGLCLPSGSNLSDADRERIRTSIQKLL
ncbi:aminotransferase class I/II-fold pyridoxal phosphate-dependent enzyme [Polaribacter litorisediminis]|uniref:DegT/DnrJ/EryC1/StrS family aminotransferase n=1 Tax=Polaribacter litorisediminis TaxID=1908341 RepID=UPI001CC12F69|nr:aminotransferase class I/II-fold pyridoxal phosphate-dependent enzyme [Polaribacter litorisediminis]UAM96582.1 aminotransferase class I/II-fold pyridoxal phosphate-dependent enzyme [Polaribacter litorisediminis]